MESRLRKICTSGLRRGKSRHVHRVKGYGVSSIAALFIFPGLSAFPQEVQQDETPAAKPVVEENVAFPILIGIP